jgi:hypothetical protein
MAYAVKYLKMIDLDKRIRPGRLVEMNWELAKQAFRQTPLAI